MFPFVFVMCFHNLIIFFKRKFSIYRDDLAFEKYCGVSAVYKQVIDVIYVIEINGEKSEPVKI